MKGSNESNSEERFSRSSRAASARQPLSFPWRLTSPPRLHGDTVCCLVCDLSQFVKQKDQHSLCAFQSFISAPVNVSELLQLPRPPPSSDTHDITPLLLSLKPPVSSAPRGHGMMSSAWREPFLPDPLPPQDEAAFIGMETSYMCLWALRFGGERPRSSPSVSAGADLRRSHASKIKPHKMDLVFICHLSL